MANDFRKIALEEGLEKIIDYRGKSPPKSPKGIPVISAKVVKGGRVLRPIEQTIDPSFYEMWMTRGIPEVGDVILTTEGPLGEVAQLDEETCRFAIGQRVVVLRGKNNVLNNTFLKFLLMSGDQQSILYSYVYHYTLVESVEHSADNSSSCPNLHRDLSFQLLILLLHPYIHQWNLY